MWSKKYDKCIKCGTTEKKHHGNGMCKDCHAREYRDKNCEKIKKRNIKWHKENYLRFKKSCKLWRKKNIDKKRKANKEWAMLNPEKVQESNRKYYQLNCEKIKVRQGKYCSNKLRNDSIFRLKSNISRLVRYHLKQRLASKNKKSTFSFLPYTIDELKSHLEKQFEPWMNWQNWGKGNGFWNIDHIKPDCSFSYKNTQDKEFQECWSLNNLRPLEAIENIKKNGKII